MVRTAYRDYLVSQFAQGPWTPIFADSPEDALGQFSMAEALVPGAEIYVGLPAPTPDVWSAAHLSRQIAQSLGVASLSGLDIDQLSAEIAREANERVARFASQKAADLGRVIDIERLVVRPEMAAPAFA